MSNTADQAVALFGQGFNCAQAVLCACGAPCGLPRETALRVAGVFGGGIARTAQTCGAVTGALMAIGLRHAMTVAGDDKAKQASYRLGQEFMRRFGERHGSVICRELMGCDISSPDGAARARAEELHQKVCTGLVRYAATLAEQLSEGGSRE